MTREDDLRFESLVEDTSLNENEIFGLILNSKTKEVCTLTDTKSYIIYALGKAIIYHSFEIIKDDATNQLIEEVGLLDLESGKMNQLNFFIRYTYEKFLDKVVTLARTDVPQKVYCEANGLISLEGCKYLLEAEDASNEILESPLIEIMECLTKAPREEVTKHLVRIKLTKSEFDIYKKFPL